MDFQDVCLICLPVVMSMAFMFHIISVLQDKLEHQGYKMKFSEDHLVVEVAQQKIKLEDLQAKVSTINHTGDSSEIRKMILSFDESNKNRIRAIEKHETLTESKIIEMKTDIMKQIQDLKDTITRLNSDQNGLKDDLAEIKINLKETFGNIFEETKEVYKVTEHIHERINKLDVIVNGQYATNIVSLIKSGMSRLAKLAVNLFYTRTSN